MVRDDEVSCQFLIKNRCNCLLIKQYCVLYRLELKKKGSAGRSLSPNSTLASISFCICVAHIFHSRLQQRYEDLIHHWILPTVAITSVSIIEYIVFVKIIDKFN